VKSLLVGVENLEPSDRMAMYLLLTDHFKGVTWDNFQLDLERKNWVLLLKEESTNILKGFSTLKFSQQTYLGEQIGVVYSGDTIVDPSAWSSTALPRSWIATVTFLHRQYAKNKLYWLLICSGFRTYRFLPTFWQEFYPHYNIKTPPNISNLMTNLAKEYYGEFYQEETGIVCLEHPQILREELGEIPSGRQANPHVQFFQKKTLVIKREMS
jgi:hypothetical protein